LIDWLVDSNAFPVKEPIIELCPTDQALCPLWLARRVRALLANQRPSNHECRAMSLTAGANFFSTDGLHPVSITALNNTTFCLFPVLTGVGYWQLPPLILIGLDFGGYR